MRNQHWPVLQGIALLALTIAFSLNAQAEDKGYCPPPLRPSGRNLALNAPQRTSSEKDIVGSVILLVRISDTGYVCSAEVRQSLSKELDAKALEAIRDMHLKPAKKDGRTVPIVAIMKVSFRRNKNGDVVTDPSTTLPTSRAAESGKKSESPKP
jgi:TonB family protein